MFRLAEEIEQRRHEIDVTSRMGNAFAACLSREANEQWNARGFFEHCFFPKKMMRAEAVAVIAGVNNDRVVSQAASFKAGQDGADALIHERHQPEIALLDASVFFRRDPKEQLKRQ